MSYFWCLGRDQKTILGSAHVAEQLLFSMSPSNLTFGFESILGGFLHFGALMGCFWSWGRVQKLCWGLHI